MSLRIRRWKKLTITINGFKEHSMTGGGGGSKPPRVTPTAAAPTAQDPAVEAAKADIRRKRQRTFSRRNTRITSPVGAPQAGQNELKDQLG